MKQCILISNEVLNNYTVNKKRMYQLCNIGYLTSTDLADYIVRELNYPFRKAYNITANLVNYCEKNKKSFKDLRIEDIKKIEPKLNENVLNIFDLNNSVKSKKSFGGTSFDNIKKMIKIYKKEIK